MFLLPLAAAEAPVKPCLNFLSGGGGVRDVSGSKQIVEAIM